MTADALPSKESASGSVCRLPEAVINIALRGSNAKTAMKFCEISEIGQIGVRSSEIILSREIWFRDAL